MLGGSNILEQYRFTNPKNKIIWQSLEYFLVVDLLATDFFHRVRTGLGADERQLPAVGLLQLV
jgi:hypothetical protein